MLESLSYRAAYALSIIALTLAVTNIVMIGCNKDLQTEIGKRQASINSGVQMSQANQALAQILAELSVAKNDPVIRDLLTSQNITVNSKAAPAKAPEKSDKKD